MRTIVVEKDIPRILLTKAISPRWPGFVWTSFSAGGYRELPDPPLPGARWLRVRNVSCGICATDLSLLYMHADPAIAPAALPSVNKFFLGHEAVGVVTEIGPGVTRFRPGERVIMDTHFNGADCHTLELDHPCVMCAHGEPQFCLNRPNHIWQGLGGGFGDGYLTHEMALYPCPPALTPDQAVLVEPLSVGLHAVLRFPPRPGQKVLVLGMGIIGMVTLMAVHAVCPEAEVTAVARYPFQAQMAEKLGARHILSGREGYAGVAKQSGGQFFSAPLNKGIVLGGYDLIYDCVANERTVNDSLRWVRADGTVVMIGAHMQPMPHVDLTPIWYQQVNLVGAVAHGMDTFEGERRHTYDWVYEFYRRGKYDIGGLITHRFPLDAYKEAIQLAGASKGKAKAIKVIFDYV